MGSITQRRGPWPVVSSSSPATASRGRVRLSCERTSSSARTSASETGVRSGLVSTSQVGGTEAVHRQPVDLVGDHVRQAEVVVVGGHVRQPTVTGPVVTVVDMAATPHDGLAREQQAVLRAFVDDDGRLRRIPARRAKRLVVLDRIVQVFEVGERYPELEVNALLRAFHDDVAALRRYLVDEGFLSREQGVYWRTGGTVLLDD